MPRPAPLLRFHARAARLGIHLLTLPIVAFGAAFWTADCHAQTILAPGDLHVTGFNADGPDDFAFATLRALEAGTVVQITDRGWDRGDSDFTGSEGVITYTVPAGGLDARSVVVIHDASTSAPHASVGGSAAVTRSGGFNVSGAGDQLLFYQEDPGPSYRFVFALTTNSTGWETPEEDPAPSSNESHVPDGLTAGTDALSASADLGATADIDAGTYTGPRTASTTAADLRSPANWSFTEDGPITLASTALPVTLVGIAARADGDAVVLTWSTASERSNAGFEIQREAGGGFERIGFVPGAGTSTRPRSYRFRAPAPSPGRHAFRLAQVDFDGARHLGPVVSAVVPPPALWVDGPHPNPATRTSVLAIQTAAGGAGSVALHDGLGRLHRRLHDGPLDGGVRYSWRIDLRDLPSGRYYVDVRAAGRRAVRTLFVVH